MSKCLNCGIEAGFVQSQNRILKHRPKTFCSYKCSATYRHKTEPWIIKKVRKNISCPVCNKEFPERDKFYNVKTYCSTSCAGKDTHIFNLGHTKTKKIKRKYPRIKVDGKWIDEHRYIMSQFVGRKLEKWEHVHHKDGNPTNNKIDNLELLSNSAHQKIEIQNRKHATFS